MKYAGMPFGMWMLFAGSFQKQLTSVLGYDAATARAITKKAKPQYRQIIAGLPEFEKADRFKMNLVNCAMLGAYILSMPQRPEVDRLTDYYAKSMICLLYTSLGGAGVLHALAPVAGLLHIGRAFHLSRSDAANHDVDVDVSRTVVPIRVSVDDGRVTGEVFFAEFQAKCLCLFHGQAVVGCISGVKADDILMALNIFRVVVLAVLSVCQQTGSCERKIATLKRIQNVRFP